MNAEIIFLGTWQKSNLLIVFKILLSCYHLKQHFFWTINKLCQRTGSIKFSILYDFSQYKQFNGIIPAVISETHTQMMHLFINFHTLELACQSTSHYTCINKYTHWQKHQGCVVNCFQSHWCFHWGSKIVLSLSESDKQRDGWDGHQLLI